MTQSVTIKNFKGVNMDEGRWADGYARYTVGLDIYGTAKNPSKISFPGILQGIFQVSAGTQAASPSAVTELITGFTTYQGNNYAIGAANPARVYRRVGSTWTWVSGTSVGTNGISCENGASPAANIIVYGANLYYAQKNYLGKYDNTNSSSQFQTFNDTTTTPRPMRVFAGNLYVGNTQNVAKYDGTTFTSQALILPSDFTIRFMEVYIDRLYIMADNGEFSRLFVWDGRSPTFQDYFNLFEESNAPALKVANGRLWIIANRGVSTTGTPLYVFDGGNFQKVITLPIQRGLLVGVGEYAGGLAIGSNDGSTATYEDGIAGIWLFDQHGADYPFSASMAFPMRNQFTGKTFGAIVFFGQNGYLGCNDTTNSSFEIFELQGANANATNIWESLPIDAGSTDLKMWHAIQINGESLASSQTLVVKYRLDSNTYGSSSWTTLKTFTSTATSNDLATYIPIGRTSKTIDIRLELTASASETVRVRSFTLTYSPASN